MPNKYIIFEAEKRTYGTEDPQYDIYWDKNANPEDYIALFKKLIEDVNEDESLHQYWYEALNQFIAEQKAKMEAENE